VIYADIIIDISLESLDRVFQYMIPEDMMSKISIGSQVMVPFGKGNRQIMGYVIGFSTVPDYDPAKMKYILITVILIVVFSVIGHHGDKGASGFDLLNKLLLYGFFPHLDTSIKLTVTGGDRRFINPLYKDFQPQKSPIRGFRITCHRSSPLQEILSLFELQAIEKFAFPYSDLHC
jgi:hypothetical protein